MTKFMDHKSNPFKEYISTFFFSIFMELHNYHHYFKLWNVFITLKRNLAIQSFPISLLPSGLQGPGKGTDLLSVSRHPPVWTHHVSGIIQHVAFCVRLLLISIFF